MTSEAEEPPRRRTWVYILLALAILLVLVAFAVLGKELFPQSTATQVSVPGVVDSPRASAVAKIENANLVPQVTVQNSDTIDKGVVMSRTPVSGLWSMRAARSIWSSQRERRRRRCRQASRT